MFAWHTQHLGVALLSRLFEVSALYAGQPLGLRV